jgi:hypothetical protein
MLLFTISATTIHLPNILCVKVLDGNRTSAIVLQHFIGSVSRTTAVDPRSAGSLLEGRRIFTYIGPPDVVEGAGSEAVHAFAVVGADDNVGEGGAVCEEEHGVGVSAFGLVAAG